jgi:hypothetical protein
MTEPNKDNPLGLRSITGKQAMNYKETMKKSISYDWIFSGWEKLIVLACFLFTVYSLGKFLWGLII